MEFVYELVYIYLHLGIYDRECNWSYWPHIILIECNCCRGRWMVWVTGSHLSSMLPDHNTNSTKFPILSTIRQPTVFRQLVSPSPITRNVYLNALRAIIEQIVVVVSYRKSRTFSVDSYYYSAQSIYGSTIILSSLTSTSFLSYLHLWLRRNNFRSP